jgi:hypothetical protein
MKIEEKLFPDAKLKPERKFVSSRCKQLERGPQRLLICSDQREEETWHIWDTILA